MSSSLLTPPGDGHEASIQALNKRYGGVVYAISRAYAADEDEGDDIAQLIWTSLSELLPRKNPEAPMGAWIRAVGLRVGMKARRRRLRWEALKAQVGRFAPGEGTWDQEPELEANVLEDVRLALAGLSVRQQQVVTLRAYEGLSVAEVAEVMACAEGTVKATYHQALKKLRVQLEQWRGAWSRNDIGRPGDRR